MSIDGRLEDLSVADMLQMLHLSRKTGVLLLESQGASAAFHFRSGNITGTRHPDRAKTVGRCLVDMGFCSQTDVEAGLQAQRETGATRLPLVSQLVADRVVSQSDGTRALERLIESAVRVVVGWDVGTFAFDPDAHPSVADDFEYVSEDMAGGIECDTRIVLMDALRILDEQSATRRAAPVPVRGEKPVAKPAPATPRARLARRAPLDVSCAETIPAPGTPSPDARAHEGSSPKPEDAQRDHRPAPPPSSTSPEVQVSLLHQYVLQLKDWQSATGASLTTLQFLSRLVDRCVLFVVRRHDLLGIGGFGLDSEHIVSSDLVAGFRMPLVDGSTLHDVVSRGRVALLQGEAARVALPLHDRIGAPGSDSILLLPLMGDRKAIAVAYCDFGPRKPSKLPLEALDILASVAGMAMQLALARSILEDEPLERELYRTMKDGKTARGTTPNTVPSPVALGHERVARGES